MDIFVQLERTRFATVRTAFRHILDHLEGAVGAHSELSIADMLLLAQQYAGIVRVHVLDPQPLHGIAMNWLK